MKFSSKTFPSPVGVRPLTLAAGFLTEKIMEFPSPVGVRPLTQLKIRNMAPSHSFVSVPCWGKAINTGISILQIRYFNIQRFRPLLG